jgi:hypothetical protein
MVELVGREEDLGMTLTKNRGRDPMLDKAVLGVLRNTLEQLAA